MTGQAVVTMTTLITDIYPGVNQATVDRAVRGYVAAGSGLPSERVIPANGPGPAPSEPYASVLMTNSRREGRSWYENEPGNTIIISTIASFAVVYQVQWFRAGAHETARRFQLWVESPGGLEEAGRRGLSYSQMSEITEIDDLISDEWEERAGLYLTIGHYRTMTQDAGIIAVMPFRVNGEEEIRVYRPFYDAASPEERLEIQ